MKNIFTRKSLLNRSLVIHPFLFAVFAILFLYAHNISETAANQIFMPILFSTLATFLLWVLLSFLLKDKIKAGLATTLFVFLFFSYGRLYELLERWDVFVPKHGVLLPAVLLLWGYCVYFIKKACWDFKNTTKLLNLVAIVLILLNLFTIVHHEIGSQGITSAQGDTENTGAQGPNSDQGNINVAINQETIGAYKTYDYIINGSFEEGDPPDNWTPDNIASRSSEQVRLGSYSVKLQGNGTGPAELFQYIPFDDYFKGRKFTLDLWYWLPPDNTVNSFISIYDGVGETSSDVLTRDGAWHRVTVTRTLDAAATTFRIALKLYIGSYIGQSSKIDYGYFDDAMLFEGDTINNIINGSFEEGDPPDDWTPNGNVTVSRSSEQVRLGSYSVKLQGNGTGPAELFQYIDFDDYFNFNDYFKGRKFTLDLWYWLPPDNTGNSFVSIYDGVGQTSSDVLTRDGAWHRVTVTRTLDAAATTFRIALKLYTPDQSSTMNYGYFDDAICVESENACDIINGSFEEGDPPDDWTPNGNVTVSRSSEQVRLGSYSVKLQGNGTGPAELFQYIPFDDYFKGRKFTLDLWYWLPPDNTVNSFVSIYDGVGQTSSGVLTRDGAWHRVTVTRTLDAAATMFRIALKLYTADQSSTMNYGYFDDAMLFKGDTINNIINGSFEEGDSPDDWTPNNIASRSSEQVRLGSYSVKLQGNGTGPAELFQYIPFDDYFKGRKFTLSVSYWLPPDNVLASFVSIYDGVGETSSDVLTRDGAWHRVTVTRTLDAAATTFRIALKLYTPDQSSTMNYGYFDDAICVESDIREPEEKATEIADSAKLNTTPDIYYIILDEYAHPDTMKEFYDYDNSDFVNNLVDKGFFVAHESKTSSAHSERSIASSLNMEDVSSIREDEAVYQKIAKNKVVDFLKSYSYRYIYFGSPLEYGRYKIDADLYYNFYQEGNSAKVSEFQHILWNTTMLLPFYDSATSSQFESYFRCGLIETLDYLREVPKMEGPKFVFAHIYCPHWPFVFGPNGEVIPHQDWRNYQDREFYLGQYIFITKQVEGVIDAILKNSSRPPIIIIQSDHGLRPSLWGTFAEFQKYGGEEWRRIFNAYYLPGTGTEGLYDSISPVNSFRLVFNLYFGTSYKFLKD